MTKPTTIASIDEIKGAVVFDSYKCGKDVPIFGVHNLIYGFNGSGKTTLSRVFASLGGGSVQERLPAGTAFVLTLSNQKKIVSTQDLSGLKDRVMVYNEDFKFRNFRWAEGGAEPVFYIGSEQTELSVELEAKQRELETKKPSLIQARNAESTAERVLSKFKTDTARDIGRVISWERQYTAPRLLSDYEKFEFKDEFILTDDQVRQFVDVSKQTEAHPRLPSVDVSQIKLSEYLNQLRTLLQKTTGTATVDFLKGHEQMSSWIRQGYDYHTSHNLTECLLCGNSLAPVRFELIVNRHAILTPVEG